MTENSKEIGKRIQSNQKRKIKLNVLLNMYDV